MYSSDDIYHKRRIAKVAYKINIPEEVINLALHYTSEYIKTKISEVDVDKEILLSQEEFDAKFPVINIPSLGYLKPSYLKYKKIHNKSKLKRKK